MAVELLTAAGGDAYPFSSQIVDVASGRSWTTIVSDAANALMLGSMLHFAMVFPSGGAFLPRDRSPSRWSMWCLFFCTR
jgi:hypothetical protein